MELIVVIPTYNEAENLPPLTEALLALSLEGCQQRLLVIDDNSPDGTGEIAETLATAHPGRIEVLHRQGKDGLGRAYLEGFARVLEEGYDLVAHMDADLSHEPSRLNAMTEMIQHRDMVIGSRYVAGGSVDPRWSWYRKALSWAANRLVVPTVLGIPVRDATSGYRLWRREALAIVDPCTRVKSNGYGFLAEMAFLASRLNCRIGEVPIHFEDRSWGASKMTLSVQLAAIREILSIRLRHRGLRP